MASSSRSNQSLIVCVKPHMKGPASTIAQKAFTASVATTPTLSVVGASPKRFHSAWKLPLAAAPHATPQMSGTHVAGFVSCSRIFQLRKAFSSPADAPLSPRSCRSPPLPSSASALVSDAFTSSVDGCCASGASARRRSAGDDERANPSGAT